MPGTRSAARHRRRFRVSVGNTPVFTLNIGSGGFSAELMRIVPPGSEVAGSIRLNGVEVGYAGCVVWAIPGDPRINLRGRIGVRFTELPPTVKRLLESPAFSNVA
jgi:hypothetical protein